MQNTIAAHDNERPSNPGYANPNKKSSSR